MQNQSNFPQGFAMDEAMKLASSPMGQALLAQLQNQNSPDLQSAMEQAKAGNLKEAKQALHDFLNSQEGKALMSQMRGSGNG